MAQSTPIQPQPTELCGCSRPLAWDEIAGLVSIRPDGSRELTEFGRDWFSKIPANAGRANLAPMFPGGMEAAAH